MQITPIKTRKVKPPQDDIMAILDESVTGLQDGDVLCVASKIVSISQGRCILAKDVQDKDELIKKEAEHYIPREEVPGEHVILTLKNNTLIPSAGIDESNAGDYILLWPQDPAKEAERICKYLRGKFKIKNLAVIITDSHSVPLRFGVLGISIGAYGLQALKDYRGQQDVFGRELKVSRTNVIDSLAVAGTLAMGEGNEQTPLAIIRDADFVEFTDEHTYQDLLVPVEEDMFWPLLREFTKYEKGNTK